MGKRVEIARESSAKICAGYVRVSTPHPKRSQSRRRRKCHEASRG